jgi:uncharacterized protein (TIGR02001 family)
MKKFLLAVLLTIGASASYAQLSTNVGLASDYRFRGISQTQNGMALQGGIDYAHSSGFYIGNWNSSVSSQMYTNGSGLESDVYAGFKKDIYKGLTIDLGTYNYFYPNATNGGNPNFNTSELYAGLGYGPVSVKYSQAVTAYFGNPNSSGSNYTQADINQSFAPLSSKLKDLSFVAHYGHTSVYNHSNLNYNDLNVGLTYALPQSFVAGVRYYTNSAMSSTFQNANTINGQRLYKDAWVATITKSFE